jgi:stage II sporulation protein Q
MNNFKKFLKEKKDLLVFMGVLVLTFIGVIAIANFATKDNADEAGGNIEPGGPKPTMPMPTPTPTPEKPAHVTFSLPITGEYVITREYFDLENTDTMEMAVKTNGTVFVESRGISYSKKDNAVFNVFSVYPGKVKEVLSEEDSLVGITVVIEHDNGVISKYSSLSSVDVKIGDIVTASQKIGVAGTNVYDLAAGIHVHLELMQDDEYINPNSAIGKQTSELASVVK